jgi:hypothetical protein
MVTVQFIKDLVEKKSMLYNLEQKKRTNELAHARWVCFWLAKKYTKCTLSKIGSVFNRDHALVLYGLRRFEENQQPYLKRYYELYIYCCKEIEKVVGFYGDGEVISSIEEVKTHYKIKHIQFAQKSNEVIGSLARKLYNFRHRPIFEEIALLSDEQLDDFESKARSFLKKNRAINKKLETVTK